MKRRILFLSLIPLLFFALLVVWMPVQASPAGVGGGAWGPVWSSVKALVDMDCPTANDCVAVGDKGLVLVTRDQGFTWHQERIEAQPDLLSVDANPDGFVLAVGSRGAIYRSQDWGRTWEALSSSTHATLRDVSLLSDGHAWIVGDRGLILHSADRGDTWHIQSSGVDHHLFGVQFLDAQTGYVVGDKATFLKTTDGGQTWASVDTNFPKWAAIYDLGFADAQNGFIAGQAGHVSHTADGGQTWQENDAGVATDIYAIHYQNGYAILGGQMGVVATTQDDGQTWTVRDSVEQDVRDVHGVFTTGPDSAWAVGAVKDEKGAAFFITHGSQDQAFQPVAGDYGPHPVFHEVAAPTQEVAYVVGSGGAIGKTMDGGDTWHWMHLQTEFPASPIIAAVSCPTATDCWVAGQVPSNPGFLYVTHDGGQTWQKQMSDAVQWPWLYDVEMVDLKNGHAAANPYMFYTTNGGESWKRSIVEGSTANVEISMANELQGWTAQRQLGHRYTTTGGRNWRRTMPYAEQVGIYFFGTHVIDTNKDGEIDAGWLVGCQGPLVDETCPAKSGVVYFATNNTDAGVSQPLPPDTPPLYTITMIDPRHGWIGGDEGTLLYTDTGGVHWVRVNLPTQALITDLAFYKNKIGFATTYTGEIFRFRGAGRIMNSFTQSTPIQVDGSFYDWHYGGDMYLDADSVTTVRGPEPTPSPQDLALTLTSRWVTDTLYFWVNITDTEIASGDQFQLALDGLNDDQWGGQGDLQLRVQPNGDFEASVSDASIAHAVILRDQGWMVELGIPASLLGHETWQQDDTVGFNVALTNGETQHTLIMEDREFPGNPAVWGTLRLMGPTLTLQNGLDNYQGTQDTFLTIWGEDGKTAHGGDETLQVLYGWGRAYSNALLRFKLPTLLQDATVQGARLSLYVITGRADPDFTIAAYRLLRPWDPETATWYQADQDTPWAKPGALQPGLDYDAAPLDTLTVPDKPGGQWLSWDISDAVSYWRDHPDENHGILLVGQNSQRYIEAYSSNYNEDNTKRPKLAIDFTLNPRPTPPTHYLYLPVLFALSP